MKEYKVKDLLTIKNGRDHKHLGDGLFPVYGSGGIMRYADDYLYDKPSILLPRKGTLDNIQYCDTPFWCVDTTYYSEVNDELANPYYLYRYLNLLDLKNLDSGTALPSMTFDSYYQIKVNLPDIETQNKIAKALYSLDQKISLNTRMNAELEAMAKQLYDHWFVQFDFPFDFAQGKPDENGKPYKSSGGKMVWNEKLKRVIPEGWEVKKMEELLVFSNGINYDKNIEGDKQYRIINVRNITSSSIFINKETLDVINLPSKQADNYLVGEDDIIIARSGTPGSTRLIMSPSGIIYCGFIIKGTPKEKDNKYILMYYLKQLEGTQATKTGGSILQNVSQDTLKSLLIIVPPKDIVVSFNNHEKKLFNGINACVESTNYLTKLRDSLLPMLMNGQVTIE